MQIALLSGANPLSATDGPVVRLSAGRWELIYDGKRESEFLIKIDSQGLASTHDNVDQLKLEFGALVQLVWKKRGSEKFISVLAKRYDD